MQFTFALFALSAFFGSSLAELCSCNGSITKSATCCDQVVNFETWTGYECGITGTDITAFQTCCGGSSVSFCREE